MITLRVRVSSDIALVLMSLAIIGVFYSTSSWILENIILKKLSKDEKENHIFTKSLLYITLFLLLADLLLIILPVFEIQLLPFNLLNFYN